MKLRNKKTGEIVKLKLMDVTGHIDEHEVTTYDGKSLTLRNLNEEWEDVEDGYWYIDNDGEVILVSFGKDWKELANSRKVIGNYFETKEEAEKAMKKLKAWKRLRDKGFQFDGVVTEGDTRSGGEFGCVRWSSKKPVPEEDMQILFGGEE